MEARKGKHPRQQLEFLSQIFKISSLGFIILSIVFFLNQVNLADYFPIKTVKVFGVNRVNKNEVHEVLLPLVNRGFFTINIEYIRDRLLQMPWIADLYVRRVWPDQVEVTLIEKKPVARWNGETLLSEGGCIVCP